MTGSSLVLILDLAGTFVFAISGAAEGVKHRLDVFGVSVLAFVAGNAGGVIRDLLIGAVPPSAIHNSSYIVVSLIAGVATFLWYRRITRLQQVMLLFDAAGLGLFAVSGTYGARLWHQSIRGRTAWYADGHWRGYAARRACP